MSFVGQNIILSPAPSGSIIIVIPEATMSKSQFQSTESLKIRLPPFIDKTTGEYITGGLDTVTLTIEKPDLTLLSGGPHLATYDSNVDMWIFTVSTGSYSQGEWRVKAISDNANMIPQWRHYQWGDYVEDITLGKTAAASADTKLGTPAGASVSADVAAVKSDTASINTKIGTPVSSVSADLAGVQTKLGTPAGASVSADIAAVQAAAAAAQSSSAIAASNSTDIRKIQLNRWKVDNNQLIVYENDQTTIYKAFDLLDDNQNPSSLRIFERVPV